VTPADLKAEREALGLSQRTLAARLGVPKDTWNRWERGRQTIPHPVVLRLALERLSRLVWDQNT
jgi:transcriptional regulator with XRE-family HTH domain